MKVIHLSAECFPVAKVGGLADVVGALPKYQTSHGTQAMVMMPLYDNIYSHQTELKTLYTSTLIMAGESYEYAIKTPKESNLGFELILVDIPLLLYKSFVYSHDDKERFVAFQRVALEFIQAQDTLPSLIHCHDHHTGLIPFMMSHAKAYTTLKDIPTVLTIHNAQYQGWISYNHINLLPDFDKEQTGLLDWNDCINSLAAGIKCAWHVTTVSRSYLDELKVSANGLEALLEAEYAKSTGILNGIDTHLWNPETDNYLAKNYKTSAVQSGKKANKKALCKTYGLNQNSPLLVFIGRLVYEKGADLFAEVFEQIVRDSEISILILGSGDPAIEEALRKVTNTGKGDYHAHVGYDEALAHRMYAGADFLLMPSRIEPCGLNQMYALRYGTIPIVSQVGGLKDTVTDIDEGGFGIAMETVSVEFIIHAVKRALEFYGTQELFKKTRQKIMNLNHSWDRSAECYLQLYKSLRP